MWPHPDVALFELLMQSLEAVLEPGAFERDLEIAQAQPKELLVGQGRPGKFLAWHGILKA